MKVGEYGFRMDDEYVSILDGMYEALVWDGCGELLVEKVEWKRKGDEDGGRGGFRGRINADYVCDWR